MISLRLPSDVVKEKRKGEKGRDEEGETDLLLIGMILGTTKHRYCIYCVSNDSRIEMTSIEQMQVHVQIQIQVVRRSNDSKVGDG